MALSKPEKAGQWTSEEINDQLFRLSSVLQDRLVTDLMARNRELEAKNSMLEMKVFWCEHSIEMLNKAMEKCNRDHKNSPRCACRTCRPRVTNPSKRCSFKSFFLELLEKHGLMVDLVNGWNDNASPDIHVSVQNCDYFSVSYAPRLMEAKSVEDKELQKLVGLFRELNSVG